MRTSTQVTAVLHSVHCGTRVPGYVLNLGARRQRLGSTAVLYLWAPPNKLFSKFTCSPIIIELLKQKFYAGFFLKRLKQFLYNTSMRMDNFGI
jgi:hypothetical protein